MHQKFSAENVKDVVSLCKDNTFLIARTSAVLWKEKKQQSNLGIKYPSLTTLEQSPLLEESHYKRLWKSVHFTPSSSMHKWGTFITVYLLFSCIFVLMACEALEMSVYHAQSLYPSVTSTRGCCILNHFSILLAQWLSPDRGVHPEDEKMIQYSLV